MKQDGWLMIVLLILSILAVYIFGKKLWLISKASRIDRYFTSGYERSDYFGFVDSQYLGSCLFFPVLDWGRHDDVSDSCDMYIEVRSVDKMNQTESLHSNIRFRLPEALS